MTITEMVQSHPVAAGIAVGILLACGSLVLRMVLLLTLRKTKAIARATSKSDQENPGSGNPGRPLFQEPQTIEGFLWNGQQLKLRVERGAAPMFGRASVLGVGVISAAAAWIHDCTVA
jgi:hypothetical protein